MIERVRSRRHRPGREQRARRFAYRTPQMRLDEQLARIGRARARVVEEHQRLRRLLDEHPELAEIFGGRLLARPRLVVDNAAGEVPAARTRPDSAA